MESLIPLATISSMFLDADEDVHSTISALHLNVCIDGHDDTMELLLEVFGEDGPESFPVISEILDNPEEYLGLYSVGNELYASPTHVVNLFDSELRQLLADRQIPIVWNTGWGSAVELAPLGSEPGVKLRIEKQ